MTKSAMLLVNVGGRVVHGVSDAGLSSEMHDVSERDELEEFLEEGKIVDVSFHHEHSAPPFSSFSSLRTLLPPQSRSYGV